MDAAPRILVIYAHPYSRQSRVNRRLGDAAQSLSNVRVHDLYESYPDFHIDIEREQSLVNESDLVVFQHPLIWYGMPSLLKEWVDTVFEADWAYGHKGNALQGKDFWLAVSAGGNGSSYSEGASHGYPFTAFLPPFQQIAALCGMRWHDPFVLFGADEASEERIAEHVEDYRQRLLSYPDWTN